MDKESQSNEVKSEYKSGQNQHDHQNIQNQISSPQLKLEQKQKYYPFIIQPKFKYQKTSPFLNSMSSISPIVERFSKIQQNNIERQVSKQRQKSKQRRRINTNHWTSYQKTLYCVFIIYFKTYFNKQQNRRHTKIFKCMEDFVKTRNSNQCRSHHQKQIKQVEENNIQALIQILKQKNIKWEESFNKRKLQLKNIQNKLNRIKNGSVRIDQNIVRSNAPQFHQQQNYTNNIFCQENNMNYFTYKSSFPQQGNEMKLKDANLAPTGLEYDDIQNKNLNEPQKRSMFNSNSFQERPKKNLRNFSMNCFNQSMLQKEKDDSVQRQIQIIKKTDEKVFRDYYFKKHLNDDQLALQTHYHMLMWVMLCQEKKRRGK